MSHARGSPQASFSCREPPPDSFFSIDLEAPSVTYESMGKVRGDVRVFGIANLLQMLSLNKSEGFLTVQQDSQKKIIQFGPSGMRLVSAGARRSHPLGEILLRSGKITHAQLDEILSEQRRTGRRLGEVVSRRGVLQEEEIENALREQISEEIYDLFTWADATFEFAEAQGAAAPADEGPLAELTVDANVMSVMLEAARRADELSRIQALIPDLRMVPVRLELPVAMDEPGLDRPVLEAVLPLIDGQRAVSRVVEESLYPKFAVLRTLYGLAQRGAIKLRDPSGVTAFRRPPVPAAARPSPRGRTALLLSDLPNFRTALSVCLRTSGYEVIEGFGSADFRELLGRHGVDAIILDVSIETDDGLAVCKRLREASKVPFLVLSGNTSKQAVINAIQSGARYVLVKPVREELLLERLSNLLKT